MSKMNFAYNPPVAAKSEVRLPLLTLGYLVVAEAVKHVFDRLIGVKPRDGTVGIVPA